MNRRKFFNVNAIGAAVSVLLGNNAFAETEQSDTIREPEKKINFFDSLETGLKRGIISY